jgi:hypothetical protein
MIQDTQVAKFGVITMYNNIGIFPLLTMWSTLTGGQHYRIYCSSEVGMKYKNDYLSC